MKFAPLTIEERAASDMTHRLDFTYEDIPAGVAVATSQLFNTAPLPVLKAGMIVKRILMYLTTPFKDASDAAFNTTTISIGDAASATRFVNAVQVNENGTEVITTFPGAAENTIYTGNSQMSVTVNSMAAKTISDLDVGRLYVLFNIEDAADPAKKQTPPFTGGGWT
jgi:hypothetical protein